MHPLQGHFSKSLHKPYAAVQVKREGKKLIIVPETVFISRADTMYITLPAEYQVISQDGDVISASGLFMISSETFDPYHVLIDYQK
ncbi:hypothetical protein [Paenibacillus terrae]|uniref:Uncharacterized protein n=1 Tax=Paenibacillus terrae TaxID=159743 RepID=A0A0D7WYH8_9BACL|nr:hypothetical protein [Paenibacillus terrae]KJD42797.1 hypothetical protein QD47_26250 [Paenibacillus terrae]